MSSSKVSKLMPTSKNNAIKEIGGGKIINKVNVVDKASVVGRANIGSSQLRIKFFIPRIRLVFIKLR